MAHLLGMPTSGNPIIGVGISGHRQGDVLEQGPRPALAGPTFRDQAGNVFGVWQTGPARKPPFRAHSRLWIAEPTRAERTLITTPAHAAPFAPDRRVGTRRTRGRRRTDRPSWLRRRHVL